MSGVEVRGERMSKPTQQTLDEGKALTQAIEAVDNYLKIQRRRSKKLLRVSISVNLNGGSHVSRDTHPWDVEPDVPTPKRRK